MQVFVLLDVSFLQITLNETSCMRAVADTKRYTNELGSFALLMDDANLINKVKFQLVGVLRHLICGIKQRKKGKINM